MKFTIHHNTTNEDEYDEIMGVIMKWERIDAINRNAISTKKGCGNEYYDEELNAITNCGNTYKGDLCLCSECEKSTKNGMQDSKPHAEPVQTPCRDNADIHSQNKELLDKDYAKTNESVGGKNEKL